MTASTAMAMATTDQLETLLKQLRVPESLAATLIATNNEAYKSEAVRFCRNAVKALGQAATVISNSSDLTSDIRITWIARAAAFIGHDFSSQYHPLSEVQRTLQRTLAVRSDAWTACADSAKLKAAAEELLTVLTKDDRLITFDHIAAVLANHVRPFFTEQQHARLRDDGGLRKLGTSANVDSANMFSNQPWKDKQPETIAILEWCIHRFLTLTSSGSSELNPVLFSYILPAVLHLTDDYDTFYRTRGVKAARALLTSLPNGLIKKTALPGLLLDAVGGEHLILGDENDEDAMLFMTSIDGAFAAIDILEPKQNDNSSDAVSRRRALIESVIFRTAIVHNLTFTRSTTAANVILLEYIQVFSSILGTHLIKYLASTLLPNITRIVKTAHFMSAITSGTDERSMAEQQLMLSACRALLSVVTECHGRASHHRATILDAICSGWLSIRDSQRDGFNIPVQLRKDIQECMIDIAKCVKSNTEDSLWQRDVDRLLEYDDCVLSDLLNV
ncbi:hypothetical protein GQ42DRAFT_26983 [Ramicandelaber brevisporus]|nr:hypothetical protein GQ42DRAFT_26983 [Ramicandelaber brevisporus]